MTNSCILGWGTVGKATALAFGIDDYYSRSEANITLEEVSKCKYIYVCLPTPTIDGKCFTDDITSLIEKIEDYPDLNGRIYVIRSTVYPGFSRDVQKRFGIRRIVSNPEFLSEDTWQKDAITPDLVVVGGDDNESRDMVVGIHRSRYKYAPIIEVDSVTAELVKYSLNVFFATKVIFANEVFDYAQKVGANYSVVKSVLEKHPWGSKNHFAVFYKEKRGVHGKCLPKDTESFANITNSPLFKVLLVLNEQLKLKNE